MFLIVCGSVATDPVLVLSDPAAWGAVVLWGIAMLGVSILGLVSGFGLAALLESFGLT